MDGNEESKGAWEKQGGQIHSTKAALKSDRPKQGK
jgi:hypothetical protein